MELARTLFEGTRIGDAIRDWMDDLASAREKRATYNRVYKELSELTFRDLSDIGFAPGNLHALAYQAAYGRTI